jgi:hypothetical protein
MQNQISIECPPELLIGLHTDARSFGVWMKTQAAVTLFREGKLFSGMAASWLGVPRMEFLNSAISAGAVLLDDTPDDLVRETSLL